MPTHEHSRHQEYALDDQCHADCDGWVYTGDGYVERPNGTREWGPKYRKCGTCAVLGRQPNDVSITQRIDPFTLVANPMELDIPF